MMRNTICLGLLVLASSSTLAEEKVKAAVGGGVGGAVGAVIGEEIGNRQGAIIGAGIGAAVGTAITTAGHGADRNSPSTDTSKIVTLKKDAPPAHGRHCPPVQAKKGHC